METIYSIFKNKTVKPGLVEIINIYDNRYFKLAVDGVIIEIIEKDSFESTVLKRSFIKQCVKQSGVKEDKLIFVKIEWMNLGYENMQDYDGNDFTNYDDFITFLKNTPNVKWKGKYYQFIKKIATGIDDLEEVL